MSVLGKNVATNIFQKVCSPKVKQHLCNFHTFLFCISRNCAAATRVDAFLHSVINAFVRHGRSVPFHFNQLRRCFDGNNVNSDVTAVERYSVTSVVV